MKQLDFDTVLEIIAKIELVQANLRDKKSYNKSFECETNREYQAYLKGQDDVTQAIINYYQNYIEGLVSQAENNLNAGE